MNWPGAVVAGSAPVRNLPEPDDRFRAMKSMSLPLPRRFAVMRTVSSTDCIVTISTRTSGAPKTTSTGMLTG